ncbi:hypothetical protein HID58_057549 [Brassica napus]|uniref:BnaC03g69640D protein n=3 Tax=Brassica TaxID=3705 RepID=A0A078GK04_BRANA|nr:uncharacterized protein LOC125583532 [Brassica napus]KAH0895120.1 hypothetical protein HID58_057549 [Brassica napus]CAF1712602.1 unnamed protein product [Brassica napus]CDY25711.1 BnaC03g69640D [Brassica napus]VDD01304.1 unnamed protein product [Brassica oleracea]
MAILLKSFLQNQSFSKTLLKPSTICRNIASSSEPHKKPLSVVFEEAVGLRPKSETSETQEEGGDELKRKLWELEKKLIELKNTEPVMKKKLKKVVGTVPELQTEKSRNLYTLFKVNEEKKQEEGHDVVRVYKELPLEMVSFVKLLHKKGYLNKANFISGEKLELGSLDEEYARTFVKFAAERFGKDYQEIAKWLSGSDLKNIVLFGCPSLEKRAIFAAKTLRKFFDIHENNVCEKCVLKEKCKFPNQSVWDGKSQNLHLSVVMKVITLYPLDLTHPKLKVPQEVQDSVSRLLTEIQNLSRTICTPLS